MNQQEQIRQAAMALVRPETDGLMRTTASNFLEQWVMTPDAWEMLAIWMTKSFVYEDVGLQLLILQLLQSKIRREVSFDENQNPWSGGLDRIQTALQSYLQSTQLQETVVKSTCLCISALVVRRGQLDHLVPSLCSTGCSTIADNPKRNIVLSLRLLSCIPLELQVGVSGLSHSNVTNLLKPYTPYVIDRVVDTIWMCIKLDTTYNYKDATEKDATKSLLLGAITTAKHWIQVACITLSQLNTATAGTNHDTCSLLVCLVQVLSKVGTTIPILYDDDTIYTCAAQALTDAIMVATDSCTGSRSDAVSILLQAIDPSVGFLSVPLQRCGESAAVAMASLASTFVTEEIDELIAQPCEALLLLLLGLQAHPVVAVRITMLDCWLTASEVSVNERHENWRAPLFQRVADTLLQMVEFNDEVDEDDWKDFRRMSVDIMVSCYFLLRSNYVQIATNILLHQQNLSPYQAEAALFSLSAVSREVNTRIQTRSGGSTVTSDRKRTTELLLQVVQHILNTSMNCDDIVQIGIARFLGVYSVTWSMIIASDDIFSLLAYVKNMLLHTIREEGRPNLDPDDEDCIVFETSKTIKLLLVGCSTTLHQSPNPNELLDCLRGILVTVLLSSCEECIAMVAEGCTRLVTQSLDAAFTERILSELMASVLQKAKMVLNSLSTIQEHNSASLSEHDISVIESLCCHLRALQEMVRFSDTSEVGDSVICNPVASIVGPVFLFLESVLHRASHIDKVFAQCLAMQQQLLKTVPSQVSPFHQQSLKYVESVFEVKQCSHCLDFFASSVEAFGAAYTDTFRDLLTHVTIVFFRVLHEQGSDTSSSLIQSFAEMNQRYFLYCPSALIGCSEFATIVATEVELLMTGTSNRESIRSIYNFLTQLFGWSTFRLSAEVSHYLQSVANILNEQIFRHGSRTIDCCMTTLIGGSQALWPVCTDCIFAILATTVTWPVPEDPDSSVARHWIEHALMDSVNKVKAEVVQTAIDLLLGFAREAMKSKPKAKMLLNDLCMIIRREKSADILLEYSL